MRSPLLRVGLALCLGCTSQAKVAEEMKDALASANEALAIALVATEPGSYVVDPLSTLDDGLRHATSLCPSNEHDTPDPVQFLAELAYSDIGCVPRSGLVPTSIAGRSELSVDGGTWEAWYDGVSLASANPVTGGAAGTVEARGEDEVLAFSGEIRVDGEDDAVVEATFDLLATIGPSALALEGIVAASGVDVTFSAVELTYDDVRGDCPRPRAGTAVVAGPTTDLVVHFDDTGDGEVIVTRGGRTSDPTSLCGFETWVFVP